MNKEEKKYAFRHYDGEGKQTRYEKTESELNDAEKDNLEGRLINAWNEATPDIQFRFMATILLKNTPK